MTLEIYPSFILRNHVVEFISTTDKDFADQLTDVTQTFTFDNYYYAPAMSGYLLKVHFKYKMKQKEFSKRIYEDFNKMKK